MSDMDTPITIDYTNWQGVRSKRHICPERLVWGSNQWHKKHQWFIDGYDADHPEKGKRYFALAGIHHWGEPIAPEWSADFTKAPKNMQEYFLVRAQGINAMRGKKYLPVIVQREADEMIFYPIDNEIRPIYFGQSEADDHPLKKTLEWRHLPDEWVR